MKLILAFTVIGSSVLSAFYTSLPERIQPGERHDSQLDASPASLHPESDPADLVAPSSSANDGGQSLHEVATTPIVFSRGWIVDESGAELEERAQSDFVRWEDAHNELRESIQDELNKSEITRRTRGWPELPLGQGETVEERDDAE